MQRRADGDARQGGFVRQGRADSSGNAGQLREESPTAARGETWQLREARRADAQCKAGLIHNGRQCRCSRQGRADARVKARKMREPRLDI
jgi:hypothetical protein